MPFVMLFNVLRQLSDGNYAYEDRHVGTLGRQCAQHIRQLVAHLRRRPFPELGLLGAGLSTLLSRIFYRSMDLRSPTLRALLQALPQRFL